MQALNDWLHQIEKNLTDLSPIDRSKIILDLEQKIQVHVSKGESLEKILDVFGAPTQVAARMRLERGLPLSDTSFSPSSGASPGASSRLDSDVSTEQPKVAPLTAKSSGRFWKWATLLLVGSFFSFLALIFIVPILLFKIFTFKTFNHDFDFSTHDSAASAHLSGDIDESGLNALIFKTTNAHLQIAGGNHGVHYDCQIDTDGRLVDDTFIERPTQGTLFFNLSDISGKADCKLQVPAKMKLTIEAGNGNVELSAMRQDVTAHLENGQLQFGKASDVLFEINAATQIGGIEGLDEFNREQNRATKSNPERYKADLRVKNGRVNILSSDK